MLDFIFRGSSLRAAIILIAIVLSIVVPLRYFCGELKVNEVHYDDTDRLILFYLVN